MTHQPNQPEKRKTTRTTTTTAQPKNQHIFDLWNSSSTGHQRAENPYSRTTEWRDTRREKLARQFRSDGASIRNNGAAGSYIFETTDGREEAKGEEVKGEWRWMSAQEAKRNELGVEDIRLYMGGISKRQQQPSTTTAATTSRDKLTFESKELSNLKSPSTTNHENQAAAAPKSVQKEKEKEKGKGIFTSLTFYINGSTYPTISDHKLKRLLADEGGNVSFYLARKSVTHVILGSCRPAATAGATTGRKKTGGGGLLAAGKLQKEIMAKTSGFGKGVKYVNVEWVIESIKAGKKLPEARFSPATFSSPSSSSSLSKRRSNGLDRCKTTTVGGGVGVPVGQRSVYDMFNKSTTTGKSTNDIG